MDRMQEEAMRRVREMQQGAIPKSSPQGYNLNQSQSPSHNQGRNNSSNQSQSKSTREASEIPVESKHDTKPAEDAKFQKNEPLSQLFKDKEKLLILLLIMLLSQEGENTELVLALLYIII